MDGLHLGKDDVKLSGRQIFAHNTAVLEYFHKFCSIELCARLPRPKACVGLEHI